jgi:hypothetical protein
VSDAPHDSADEPVTGPPAGAASGSDAAPPASGPGAGSGPGPGSGPGLGSGPGGGAGPGAGGASAPPAAAWPVGSGRRTGTPGSPRRRVLGLGLLRTGSASDPRQRRRRQWFIAGISVAAAILVVALCAGGLSVISAVDGVRDRAADARDSRQLQNISCLELERRLNKRTPPGATTTPAARAAAVRDENAAVRIYVDGLHNQADEDVWRQLLDARTVFADALDKQAKSRTQAFYVAPRTTDSLVVTDELTSRSPASCAGSVRRLAAPDL